MYQQQHTANFQNKNLSIYDQIVLALFLYKDISQKHSIRKLNRENFKDWISLGSDFSISNVLDGVHALDRINDNFSITEEADLFYCLQRNLSKIADTPSKVSKELRKIICTLNNIPSDTDLNLVLDLFYKQTK